MPGSTRNDLALLQLKKLFPDEEAAFILSVRASSGSAKRDDLWMAYRLLFDKMLFDSPSPVTK